MKDITRAFFLACKDMFQPKVLWISLLPCLLTALLWSVILWFAWDPMTNWTKTVIAQSWLSRSIHQVMSSMGWSVTTDFSPYFSVIIFLVFIVITLLVMISFVSIISVVNLLETQKYYVGLRRAKGGSFFGSLWNTIFTSCCAIFLMIVTFPFWWIPPLFSVIPPCIWGWLTARLMSYDILAIHADKIEREKICQDKRFGLMVIGIVTGLMGTIPTFFWVSSIVVFILLPFVALFMMWLYSLIFIFAALWFGHYLLFALRVDRQLRGESR